MVQLLHIDASARRESYSRRVSRIFADAWRAANPDGGYVYRDLAANPVPHVDEAQTEINENSGVHGLQGLEAMEQAVRTPEQQAAWAITKPLVEELLAADVLLIGTPMYNFSVPSTLKAWIDRVTYMWVNLEGKKGVIVTARGGAYGPESPRAEFEYQERYLRAYFSQLKLTDLTFINTELTMSTVIPFLAQFRPMHDSSYEAARQAAQTMGRDVVGATAVA